MKFKPPKIVLWVIYGAQDRIKKGHDIVRSKRVNWKPAIGERVDLGPPGFESCGPQLRVTEVIHYIGLNEIHVFIDAEKRIVEMLNEKEGWKVYL